jgi:hypothetical protein
VGAVVNITIKYESGLYVVYSAGKPVMSFVTIARALDFVS